MKKTKLAMLVLLPLLLTSCRDGGKVKPTTYEAIDKENQAKLDTTVTNAAEAKGVKASIKLNDFSAKLNYEDKDAGTKQNISVSNLRGGVTLQYANLNPQDLTQFDGLLEVEGLKGTLKYNKNSAKFSGASLGAYINDDKIYLNTSDETLRKDIKNLIKVGLNAFMAPTISLDTSVNYDAMIDQLLSTIPEKAIVKDITFSQLVQNIIGSNQITTTYAGEVETGNSIDTTLSSVLDSIKDLNDQFHFFGVEEREDGGLTLNLTLTKDTYVKIFNYLNNVSGTSEDNSGITGDEMFSMIDILGLDLKVEISKDLYFEGASIYYELKYTQNDDLNSFSSNVKLDATVDLAFNEEVNFPSDLASYQEFMFSNLM